MTGGVTLMLVLAGSASGGPARQDPAGHPGGQIPTAPVTVRMRPDTVPLTARTQRAPYLVGLVVRTAQDVALVRVEMTVPAPVRITGMGVRDADSMQWSGQTSGRAVSWDGKPASGEFTPGVVFVYLTDPPPVLRFPVRAWTEDGLELRWDSAPDAVGPAPTIVLDRPGPPVAAFVVLGLGVAVVVVLAAVIARRGLRASPRPDG